MDYEVWKWLDSGRWSSASIPSPSPCTSPIRDPARVRVFGRAVQRRFARRACRRMALLTTAALHRGPRHDTGRPAPPRFGQLTVAPATDQPRARDGRRGNGSILQNP
jgi:hypothetical protein